MTQRWLPAFAILVIALPGAASAVPPAIDPTTVGQGQVLSGMNQGYSERNARSKKQVVAATSKKARTAQTCANAARMTGTGERGRGLARLRQLCRQAGY